MITYVLTVINIETDHNGAPVSFSFRNKRRHIQSNIKTGPESSTGYHVEPEQVPVSGPVRGSEIMICLCRRVKERKLLTLLVLWSLVCALMCSYI